MTDQDLIDFYEREYEADRYAPTLVAREHPFYSTLVSFLDSHGLHDKKCLEVGCGRGAFQTLVDDYTGVDVASSVRAYMRKPFYQASATALPFPDNAFDAIWSYAVLEHVVDPEAALKELRRVLKPRAFMLLMPAWQCRPWAAEGYPVRPFSDFSLKGKLIKASVPLRDSLAFRSLKIFPARFLSLLGYLRKGGPVPFRYRSLVPNLTHYWMSDGDAVNSMDPFDAYLWFVSRGDRCVNYASLTAGLFIRTGPLVIQKLGLE